MVFSVPTADHGRRLAVFVAVTAGLLFLDGQLGPASFFLRRGAAAAILAIVLMLSSGRLRARRIGSILVSWAAVVLVAQAPTALLALLGYVLGVALIVRDDESEPGRTASGLAQTCLCYVLLASAIHLVPHCRILAETLSDVGRGYLRVTTGADQYLSPTALGAPAALVVTISLFWRWMLVKAWPLLIAAVVAPACWFLMLPLVTLPASAGPIANSTRAAFFSLFWLACAAILDSVCSGARGLPRPVGRGMRRPLLIAACLASLFIGATLVGVPSPVASAGRSILVHNRGGLDWDRPTFGRFGVFSGGMFGLLPVYARANGYGFEVLDRDVVAPGDLAKVQTFVLINSPKEWKGDELQTIRDFVARGGGLLILGDHTDVYGLMKGFNSLLADFDITFRFDSAYPARLGWRGCLSTSPDAVTTGWAPRAWRSERR